MRPPPGQPSHHPGHGTGLDIGCDPWPPADPHHPADPHQELDLTNDLPALPDLPEIPDEVYITDTSQFEALTSGLRMRILNLCYQPLSVREIAERLEMPATRLYYHINLLEESGFIQVVHTRRSGARLEKVYRIAGLSITPGPELMDNIEDTAAAAKAFTAIVIEPARAETEDALKKRMDGEEHEVYLGRAMAVLTPTQVEALITQHSELIESMSHEQNPNDDDARAYAFTFSLVPSEPH